jgi:hypothetical protein
MLLVGVIMLVSGMGFWFEMVTRRCRFEVGVKSREISMIRK